MGKPTTTEDVFLEILLRAPIPFANKLEEEMCQVSALHVLTVGGN
jgi:hypothetical protein